MSKPPSSQLELAVAEAARRQEPLGQLSDYALLAYTLEEIGDDYNTLGLPAVNADGYTFHPITSALEISSVLGIEIGADEVVFAHSQVRLAGSGLYVTSRPDTEEAAILKSEVIINPDDQQIRRPLGEVALQIADSRPSLRKINETGTATTYVSKRSKPLKQGQTTFAHSQIGVLLCEDTVLTLTDRHRTGLYDQGLLRASGNVRLAPPSKGYLSVTGNRVLATGDVTSPIDTIIDHAAAGIPAIPTIATSVRMANPTHIDFLLEDKVHTYGRAETGLKTDSERHHQQVAAALSWTDVTEEFMRRNSKAAASFAPEYDSRQAISTVRSIITGQLTNLDPTSSSLAQGPLEVVRFLGKYFHDLENRSLESL